MADSTVDKARTLLEERLAELDAERKSIQSALAGLGARARRGPGRPRGSRSGTTAKRRRRRRGGTRAEQALKHVTSEPGLTASQIAEKLKIKPNYVYRVMGELEADGKVKKAGKGYKPA